MTFRLPSNFFKIILLLAGTFFFLAAVPAWGGEQRLRTSPVVPEAGQSFTIIYDSDECQIFFSGGPLDRIVEVVGSTVLVTVEYLQNQICVPSPSVSWSWSVGPLTAGAYTLVLKGQESLEGGSTTELGRIPLTIVEPGSSEARVVPAVQPWVMLLLGLSVAATALFGMRGSQR